MVCYFDDSMLLIVLGVHFSGQCQSLCLYIVYVLSSYSCCVSLFFLMSSIYQINKTSCESLLTFSPSMKRLPNSNVSGFDTNSFSRFDSIAKNCCLNGMNIHHVVWWSGGQFMCHVVKGFSAVLVGLQFLRSILAVHFNFHNGERENGKFGWRESSSCCVGETE